MKRRELGKCAFHFLQIHELRRMDDYKKNITEMASVVSMMTVSGT